MKFAGAPRETIEENFKTFYFCPSNSRRYLHGLSTDPISFRVSGRF